MSVKVDYVYNGLQPDHEIYVTQGFIEKKLHSVTCNPVIINLIEDVDTDMALHITQKLSEAEEKNQPFVPCFIQSMGGDAYALMCIVETIRQSKVPVYTIVTGLAASAAACIFSCGTRRFMTKNAKLLLHDVSVDFGDDSSHTTSNLKVESKEMRRLNRTIFRVMDENTQNDPEFFSKVVGSKRHNDIYVDAKQALKWNLATDMGFPVVKITTTINMECKVLPTFGVLQQNVTKDVSVTVPIKVEEEKEEDKDKNSSFKKTKKRKSKKNKVKDSRSQKKRKVENTKKVVDVVISESESDSSTSDSEDSES